ncbi:MAG: hypothetical protein ACFB3T_04635 [Geminicoccaceae bacterium]
MQTSLPDLVIIAAQACESTITLGRRTNDPTGAHSNPFDGQLRGRLRRVAGGPRLAELPFKIDQSVSQGFALLGLAPHNLLPIGEEGAGEDADQANQCAKSLGRKAFDDGEHGAATRRLIVSTKRSAAYHPVHAGKRAQALAEARRVTLSPNDPGRTAC